MRKRNESISEIRTEFEACRGSRAELYEMYAYDTRMGVQKLIQKYQKQDEKLANERLRLKQMRPYEEKYSHCDYICGIDEVGRGPLAGPVVAAAVILPKDAEILYLNDSKKLSAKRREELYDEIQEKQLQLGSEWRDRRELMRSIFFRQPMKRCVRQSVSCL